LGGVVMETNTISFIQMLVASKKNSKLLR